MQIESPGCPVWPTGYKSEVSRPDFGFDEFAREAHWTQENLLVYLLDYQFIIKIYNLVRKSEVVKWSHYSQSAKFLKHEEMILLLL